MKTVLRAAVYGLITSSLLTACEIGEEGIDEELAVLDDDVRAELERVPDVKLWADRNGLPLFVTGQFGARGADAPATAGLVAKFFRLSEHELVLDRETVDETGRTTLRFTQVRNGLPVVGAMLKLDIATDGMVDATSGDVRGDGDLDATPSITADQALTTANDDPANKQASDAQLVYFATDDGPRLAWQVTVGSSMLDTEHVFVGAKDGVVLDRQPIAADALSRQIYTLDNTYLATTYQLPGTLRRVEGGAATRDAQMDANYTNLGKVYNCFKTRYGRDSYNGVGGAMRSTTHVNFNALGTSWNAMWLGAPYNQMLYSNDVGDNRSPAYDLDVTAHEIGHGITQFESALQYKNESGAINEGMSDVQSAVCDNLVGDNANIWLLGEDVYTKSKAGDALRYMNNPTRDGQSKDYYPERYTGTADNGGVHLNSGILNLAFYLTSQGGKHPRGKTTIAVTGIGIVKAARIYYRANAVYLTPTSNFKAARAATINAAKALYGAASAEAQSVAAAWTAVGVL